MIILMFPKPIDIIEDSDTGIKAILLNDFDESEESSPRSEGRWQIITQLEYQHPEIDQSFDADDSDLGQLADQLDAQGAVLISPVWRLQEIYGESKTSYSIVPTSGYQIVGLAAIDKPTLKYFADANQALKALATELSCYADWRNGDVYAYCIEDAQGKLLEAFGGLYGLSASKELLKQRLGHYRSISGN